MTKACDFVIWAGDLNFRVDMSYDAAMECCKKSDYGGLLAKDEFRTLHSRTGKIRTIFDLIVFDCDRMLKKIFPVVF